MQRSGNTPLYYDSKRCECSSDSGVLPSNPVLFYESLSLLPGGGPGVPELILDEPDNRLKQVGFRHGCAPFEIQ